VERDEIECELMRTRRWVVDTWSALPPGLLTQEVTQSEHDPAVWWTALDHLAHVSHILLQPTTIVERHFFGRAEPVEMRDGPPMLEMTFGMPAEQAIPRLHEMTHQVWAEYRGLSLDEVLAAGQRNLARTLALLGSLSAAQLQEKIEGSHYGDGTVGPLLTSIRNHSRIHWQWVVEGFASGGRRPPAAPA
jgi:hypothetical protein